MNAGAQAGYGAKVGKMSGRRPEEAILTGERSEDNEVKKSYVSDSM